MVLTAGKCTRLFPLTGELPSPLLRGRANSLSSTSFELLKRTGVKEGHVNVHYGLKVLRGCYRGETQVDGTSLTFTRKEWLMGTAGGQADPRPLRRDLRHYYGQRTHRR
jgi:mannose-1-phosphate guanylyltransferase